VKTLHMSMKLYMLGCMYIVRGTKRHVFQLTTAFMEIISILASKATKSDGTMMGIITSRRDEINIL